MKYLFLIRLNGRPFSRSKYVGVHKTKLDSLRSVNPSSEVIIKLKGNKLTVSVKTN